MNLGVLSKEDSQVIFAEAKEACRELVKRTSLLASVPEVGFTVQRMFLVSTYFPDLSLVNEKCQFFNRLRNPKSLKASLYQVAASSAQALNLANRNMLHINKKLQPMKGYFEDALEVLIEVDSGNVEGAEETLNIIKTQIVDATGTCKKKAEEICKQFDSLVEEIDELSQAITGTKGYEEEQQRQTGEQRAQLEARIEACKNRNAAIEKEMAERKKIVEEMKEELERATAKLWESVEDKKKQVEQRAKDEADLAEAIKKKEMESAAYWWNYFTKISQMLISTYLPTLIGYFPGKSEQRDSRDSAEELRSHPFMAVLERAIEDVIKPLSEETSGNDEIDKVMQSLEMALNFSRRADDEISNALNAQVKEVLSSLRKLRREENSQAGEKDRNKKMKSLAQLLSEALDCYQNKTNPDLKMKKAHKRVIIAKELEREKTKELEMLEDQQRMTDARLKTEMEGLDQLSAKHSEVQQGIQDILFQLKSLDAQKMTILNAIEFLNKAAEVLADLKIQWMNLAMFFDALALVVETELTTCITGFLQYTFVIEGGENLAEHAPLNKALFIRKSVSKISREALKSIALAVQLDAVSQLYLDISEKHLMPTVNAASKHLAMSKEQAEEEMERLKEASIKAQNEVERMINEHLEEEKSITNQKQRLALPGNESCK